MADSVTTPEPWPDWLADLDPEDRVRAIADAVAECYGDHQCQGKADHFRESAGGQHCTVGVAGDLLLRLLGQSRQQPPVPSADLKATLAILRSRVTAALDRAFDGDGTDPADAVMAVVSPVVRQVWASRAAPPAGGSGSFAEALELRSQIAGALGGFLDLEQATIAADSVMVVVVPALRTQSAPVPSAEHSLAIAALRRLALDDPMTDWQPGNHAYQAMAAEMEARRLHAAGTLETITRLAEPVRPENAEVRAEVLAQIAADWTIDPSTGRSNSSGQFRAMVSEVERLLLSEFRALDRRVISGAAGLVVAQLAHKHGLAPAGERAPAELPREPLDGNPVAEVPPEPVMELLGYASDLIGTANEDGSLGGAAVDRWRDRYKALVAEYAAAKAGKVESDREFLKRLRELPEAHRPVPLLPDGTFVEVQIKGHQTCEGYLTAGMWHGERYGFLLDKPGEDGKFVAAFPPVAGSVHLITAVPEPGSEPEQPDPWQASELEAHRHNATVFRRNWHGDRDKLVALRTWAEQTLPTDMLGEALAILQKDFRRPEDDIEYDEEPPF